MNRRRLLQGAAVIIPFLSGAWALLLGPARAQGAARSLSRVRPGDPAWPPEADWNQLSRDVGGRLVKVRAPLAACTAAPASPACAQVFEDLKNPYYLGDEVRPHAVAWLGRRLDVATKRLCGGRPDDR
jgi:hypothetical protein